MATPTPAPRAVVVVGAGVIGLSTAWFLQEYDIRVTVLDRGAPTEGASWGNAGWITPGLAAPLGEPRVLRAGLTSFLDPHAALRIPPRVDVALWLFLLRFARRCTHRSWLVAARQLVALNEQALEAFDHLVAGGVATTTISTPIVAAFRSREESRGLAEELAHLAREGGGLPTKELSGAEAREAAPQLSTRIGYALELHDQRVADPAELVSALQAAVCERGGTVRRGVTVRGVERCDDVMLVDCAEGDRVEADAVVLATGAWLPELARSVGVRTHVQAGRGYSFTVPVAAPVAAPIYLPATRVVASPHRGRLRLAGTMEFLPPGAPLDPRRIESIIAAVRPFLTGVDWTGRADEWVGARSMSSDGLPLVGATADPAVFVASGHGMWGVTLGPVTGRRLAHQIATGSATPTAFDPLRRP